MKLLKTTVALCSILGITWHVMTPKQGIRFNVLSPFLAVVWLLLCLYHLTFCLTANTTLNYSSAFNTDLEKSVARFFHKFVVFALFIGVYLGASLSWPSMKDLLVAISTAEKKLKGFKETTMNHKRFELKFGPTFFFVLFLVFYITKLIYMKRNRSCLGWSQFKQGHCTPLGSLLYYLICSSTKFLLFALLDKVQLQSKRVLSAMKAQLQESHEGLRQVEPSPQHQEFIVRTIRPTSTWLQPIATPREGGQRYFIPTITRTPDLFDSLDINFYLFPHHMQKAVKVFWMLSSSHLQLLPLSIDRYFASTCHKHVVFPIGHRQ